MLILIFATQPNYILLVYCDCFWTIMDAFLGKFVDFGVNKFKSINDFDENLETLERNVKLLSDRASDVKTNVENRERFGKKKRKREVGSWFDEVMKVEEGLRALKEEVTRGRKNGGALEKMNGRVGELLEQSKHFGTLVHDMYESEECLLLAPQVHEEKSKQNLEAIWTWLHVENVSSIGIYGMGGVGKTTLAKHIHNRPVNEIHYQVRWVTVSQGFRIKRLQDDIAKIVKLDLSDEVDELRRTAKLNRAFEERKNIVIILDDVWDRLSLEKLGDPLGVEGLGYESVARSGYRASCDSNYSLKSLADENVLSPDIELVAKSMARRCKGSPIELITLVGSMRGVTDMREWRNALKIDSLPNLVGLLSGLTELSITGCDKMKKLFPWAIFQDLKNLETLEVIECHEMEEIIAEEATDQDGSRQLGTRSDILILPKLKKLRLSFLPKWKSICEGKLVCDSLEYMRFRRCPKLKKLPFYAPTTNAHPLPALKIKVEENWWETLEWEQSHLKTLFQPHIKYLRY
ncbi:probable disease resistance protein At4g27220 [Lycium ferocissimum]|uniref:probable disease resistance protein At4g27220 n=1 Tax=Lycium ferocissimum TaxID=112874 RepID=UPI002814D2AA|nr:probable disease resistance protein At4g27220 [Lycium ferocissimum]